MKKLGIALFVIIALYCAYWFVGKGIVADQAGAKISQYRDAGYVIEHAPIDVAGFPLKFETNIGPVKVATPSGASVSMDQADISGKAYFPLAWNLTHQGKSRVTLPGLRGPMIFDALTQDAKIDLQARAGGGLKRLSIDASNVALDSQNQLPLPIQSLSVLDFDFSRAGADAVFDLRAEDAALNSKQLGDMAGAFGNSAQLISGTTKVSGFETARPHYASDNLSLLWGPGDMGGGFDLTRNDQGGLDGKITLNVANIDALMSALVKEGVVSGGEQMMMSLVLNGLPKTEDGRTALSLSVSNSRVSLGPFKLGRLPF